MPRVYNSSGDIKCMNEKGEVKYFSRYMVDTEFNTLRERGFSVVDAPEAILPILNEYPITGSTTLEVLNATTTPGITLLVGSPENPVDFKGKIEDYTKQQIMDLLKLHPEIEWKPAQSKEELFNLLKQ